VIVQGARYLFGPVESALVIPPHQPADALVRHPDFGDVTSINGRLRGEINDLDRFFEWLGDEPPRHIPLVTASRREIPRVWVWRRLMTCDRRRLGQLSRARGRGLRGLTRPLGRGGGLI